MYQPVMSQADTCTSQAYACMYCMHCPRMSQAKACRYCMGPVVLISSLMIYFYLQLLCSCIVYMLDKKYSVINSIYSGHQLFFYNIFVSLWELVWSYVQIIFPTSFASQGVLNEDLAGRCQTTNSLFASM